MTTGMTAGMTFMKFARGQIHEMLKPELLHVRSFTWGMITCWALLSNLALLERRVSDKKPRIV